MLRSLYASISGLRNHQVRMDTIGNNIANVNTVGYKSSRVTFTESLSQLLSGANRSTESKGGTNPMQVGLGMHIGSIDTRLGQGNLESTGQITDLSIEGNAYFAVSNGEGTYYTRNGAFQFDSQGKLVLPTNGYVLQGKLADSQGKFPTGALVGDIKVPFNDEAPAKPTENIAYSRNLDADSAAKGSVSYTQKFLHHAVTGDSVIGLMNGKGDDLGMKAGDILTFTATDTATNTAVTQNFTVAANTTMANVTTAMTAFLSAANLGGLGTSVSSVTMAQSANLRGALTISGNANIIKGFQVTSNRPISSPKVTNAFSVPTTIPAGSAPLAIVSDTLRSGAKSTDLMSEVFDATGLSLGLEAGDAINITGSIGDKPANNVTALVYATGAGGTTMADLVAKIKDNFKLPDRDGTAENNFSVSLNSGGSDDNIPDGAIVIRGMPEKSFDLKDIAIVSNDNNNTKPSPNAFNANTNVTSLRAAQDTGVAETSISVFDGLGKEHTAIMKFIPTATANAWLWEMKMAGQEEILSGQKGKLNFGLDGSLSSFTFDDGSSQFSFDPKNGSGNVKTTLKVGGPKDFTGLTQFRSPTTASAVNQDGYGMGRLRQVSIGEDGVVTGAFTNGTNKALAQIMIADFTNPGGLQKIKDGVYTVSANSGDAILGIPGTQSASVVKPGSLELSNVELAQEFTDMITTQRGYQANARVITVSDSLLEELIALKR